MTLTAINVLAFGQVGEAFGRWVCRWSVKDLMSMYGCAEQTAKKWRQGQLPENKHMVAMVERWGEEFLLAIFAPVLAQSDMSLERQLCAIENRITLIRERLVDDTHPLSHRGPIADQGGDTTAQLGRIDGESGPAPTRSWAKAGRTCAVALALIAVLHGPLADVMGLGDFGARMSRSVRVRAGRSEIRIGGGWA